MELLGALLLIFVTGFYAGTETALYRAHWVRLATWQKSKISGSGLGLKLLDWRDSSVIATLVGTNLSSVFASMLVSRFCVEHFGPAYAGIGVAVLVALTLLFGEYLPKAYANAWPNRWLRIASWPLAISLLLFSPGVILLRLLLGLLRGSRLVSRPRLLPTRQDFLSALRQRECDISSRTSTGSYLVSRLAARLFRSSATRVSEVAIPLNLVRSLPHDASREDALRLVREYGFSRIPVYRRNRADIIGVILARDLLEYAPESQFSHPTELRIRKIQRLSADTRIMEAMERMQRRAEHIAAVVNSSGRITGIVTLEDILEELVGEIRSED